MRFGSIRKVLESSEYDLLSFSLADFWTPSVPRHLEVVTKDGKGQGEGSVWLDDVIACICLPRGVALFGDMALLE